MFSDIIYLHLRKVSPWKMNVAKIAKSIDAQVEPGDVIVKAKITVPDNFFTKALPYVEIQFQPEDALPPVVTIDVDPEDEA